MILSTIHCLLLMPVTSIDIVCKKLYRHGDFRPSVCNGMHLSDAQFPTGAGLRLRQLQSNCGFTLSYSKISKDCGEKTRPHFHDSELRAMHMQMTVIQ